MLSPLENDVINLIRENPYATQKEMADKLSIPRSTLAGLISSLVQRKVILGKAYMLNENPYVLCIGGMNVDRKYRLKSILQSGTSNPVESSISVGGVARNVAENLGRMGLEVRMLSLAGQDQDFQIIKQASQDYVNLQSVQQIKDYATSTYTAILDRQGDMQVAYADMNICEKMTKEWLESNQGLILQAKMVVMDLNLPLEATTWLINFCHRHEISLTVIPVSQPKMAHLPRSLHGVDWLIVNRGESLTYLGQEDQAEIDTMDLAKAWLDRGVNHVVITQGSEGFVYANRSSHIYYPIIKVDHLTDATGAGDAFSSGVIFGNYQEYAVDKALQLGLVNATMTIQSPLTVRSELNGQQLLDEWKSYFKTK